MADGANPGHDAAAFELATRAMSAPRLVLTGDSLLQFQPFAITAAVLADTQRAYAETTAGDGTSEPVLHVIEPGQVTPIDATISYAVTGVDAAKMFEGRWLPVPYLRSADVAGARAFEGPSNWARLLLSGDGHGSYRGVLAFDTALLDQAEVAPTRADATAGTIFGVPSALADLGWFVSEPWVDEWLANFSTPSAAHDDDEDSAAAQPQLAPLAHYLALLKALDAAQIFPKVVVADPQRQGTTATAVDLVLAFTRETMAATYVARDALAKKQDGALWHVPIRDLGQPWQCHYGAAPAAAAFSRAAFGDEMLSRLSGRMSSLDWPSLLRIGVEARRLLTAHPLTAPAAGTGDLLGALDDETQNEQIWRFADTTKQSTAFVTGSLLAHVTETGETLAALEHHQPGATRARFAPASLLTFAAMELVHHAIAGLNPAVLLSPGAAAPLVQRLQRVVVSVPEDLSDDERAHAQHRIASGIKLATDILGKSAMPLQVAFAAPPSINVRDAFLYNDIERRFGGRAQDYLRTFAALGQPTASPRLRLGLLSLDDATTTLSISTVATETARSFGSQVELSDVAGRGGNAAVDALAAAIIKPALIEALARARLFEPTVFLEHCLSAKDANANLADRFVRHLLRPAARALLLLTDKIDPRAATTPVQLTLRALLTETANPVVERLQELALAAGANMLSLLDTPVRVTPARVRELAAEKLRPMLRCAGRLMRNGNCDVAVLTGRFSELRLVKEVLLQERAARADRLIALASHRSSAWRDVSGAHGRLVDMTLLVAAGSVLSNAEEVPPSQQLFIGVVGADGCILDRDILFRRTAGASKPEHATVSVGGSVMIGARQLDTPDWPARALVRVDLAGATSPRAPTLPLSVTLQLSDINDIDVVAMKDARGRDLPPSAVSITTATHSRHVKPNGGASA